MLNNFRAAKVFNGFVKFIVNRSDVKSRFLSDFLTREMLVKPELYQFFLAGRQLADCGL